MENEKKLNLMKFWLFGTVLILFVAFVVYIGGAWGTGLAIFGAYQFWLSLVISIVVAVGIYKYYESYLNKQ